MDIDYNENIHSLKLFIRDNAISNVCDNCVFADNEDCPKNQSKTELLCVDADIDENNIFYFVNSFSKLLKRL